MTMTVRELAKGPALGDALDRVKNNHKLVWYILGGAMVVFILVAIASPQVGLLLLGLGTLVAVAFALYSRKQVHGHGRLAHHRGQRR